MATKPSGAPALAHQFGEAGGAAGHDARVLVEDRIADRDGGGDDADQLIDGEVPRLDGQQDADGMELDPGLAQFAVDLLGLEEVGGLFGIVGGDAGAQVDLALTLGQGLAHLLGDGAGQAVAVLGQQFRQGLKHGQTRLDVALRPVGTEDRVGLGQGGLDGLVGVFGVFLQRLFGEGIEGAIGHGAS